MSNEPAAPARGNKVRWIITGCLLVLAVLCVGWIVSQKMAGEQSDVNSGTPFVAPAALVISRRLTRSEPRSAKSRSAASMRAARTLTTIT